MSRRLALYRNLTLEQKAKTEGATKAPPRKRSHHKRKEAVDTEAANQRLRVFMDIFQNTDHKRFLDASDSAELARSSTVRRQLVFFDIHPLTCFTTENLDQRPRLPVLERVPRSAHDVVDNSERRVCRRRLILRTVQRHCKTNCVPKTTRSACFQGITKVEASSEIKTTFRPVRFPLLFTPSSLT